MSDEKPFTYYFMEDDNCSSAAALARNLSSGYGPEKFKWKPFVEYSAFEALQRELAEVSAKYNQEIPFLDAYQDHFKKIRARIEKLESALKEIVEHYEDGKVNGGHMYVTAREALE